ncbi:hypothetical protein C8Q76DRAFT_795144 [Earliella scabrosa]|nr:hypothetical protein C8Q76DRAFT_795144 [Earliella scabrosa]
MDPRYVLPPPQTPPWRPPRRDEQPVGEHFSTPQGRRAPRKNAEVVTRTNALVLRDRLAQELEDLLHPPPTPIPELSDLDPSSVHDAAADDISDLEMASERIPDCDIPSTMPPEDDPMVQENHVEFTAEDAASKRSRRLQPDEAAHRLYSTWLALIPTLVPNYLTYLQAVQGRTGGGSGKLDPCDCTNRSCMLEVTSVTCLYFDHLATFEIQSCSCSPLPPTLVKNGLFPTAPSQPRVAVSIDLLDFYFALFERSADAVTALAGALKTLYQRRGFPVLNEKALARVSWDLPEDLCGRARRDIMQELRGRVPQNIPADVRQNVWADGGDVHVAIDATFSQRHNLAAGDSPWFHEPKYFISKNAVDAVGTRIEDARKKKPRPHTSEVPQDALDECEKSFEAADEQKAKTHGVKFDDTGLMALMCRHDIVLFLANVDSPGEQQKYGVALVEHLMSFLPCEATVAVFYDIGCVLDRSLHLYDILPQSIVERLVFATSVMHAYGHQWSCQLVYNPRLREGLGLSEGEGTERVWSKFRKLIGVTRTSGRSRRIWYLDRHADSVNATAREDLGNWLRSRLKNGVEARTAKADQELHELQIPMPILRQQWQSQRTAQLSVRNHAPARLKKELDSVLHLQSELDDIKKFVNAMQTHIATENTNPQAHHFLRSLQQSHARTIEQVEALYASLNVPEEFPEVLGLSLPFVRTLVMARNLKINIRKRAIGSFFEWDKLDRAAGGRDQPLGTKLHQHTRKAIAKRTPALLTAIRKFNGYCDTLKREYKKSWKIPLPKHLPVELGALRNDPSLLTDVWVTPVTSESPTPRWLDDPDMRRGIRVMLAKDRCLEERRRLGDEADNLCRWYGNELAAVELALRTSCYSPIAFLLQQRKAELLLLQARWRTPLASELRFISRTEEAARIAERLSGTSQTQPLTWVHLTFSDGHENEDHAELEDYYCDPDTVLAQDTIAQLVGDDAEPEEDEDAPGLHTDAILPIVEHNVVGSHAPGVAFSFPPPPSLHRTPQNPIRIPGPAVAGVSDDECTSISKNPPGHLVIIDT